MPEPPVDKPRISAACARGRHNRCHGTVYIWPPSPTQRFAPCACEEPECWHANGGKKSNVIH